MVFRLKLRLHTRHEFPELISVSNKKCYYQLHKWMKALTLFGLSHLHILLYVSKALLNKTRQILPLRRAANSASNSDRLTQDVLSCSRYNVRAYYENINVSKAVPLQAMEALGGRGSIAPTHSRPRH
jgi:hypothetical protein